MGCGIREELDTRKVEVILGVVVADTFDQFIEEALIVGDQAGFHIRAYD